MKKICTLAIALVISLQVITAQSVQLNNSFGTNGLLVTNLSKQFNNRIGNDFVVQTNGALLIAGRLSGLPNSQINRYYPDGTLDNTFQRNIPGGIRNYGLGVQSDNKVLFYLDSTVTRFDSFGKIDSTFGTFGITELNQDVVFSTQMLVQPDDKALVFGDAQSNSGALVFYAARLNADGGLDTTFGNAGEVILPSNGTDLPWDAALFSTGQTLLAGITDIQGWQMQLYRLNVDGSIDTTFGDDGRVISGLKGNAEAFGVAVQPDDKFLVTGFTKVDGAGEAYLARFNFDGSPDLSFGDQGVQYLSDWEAGLSILIRPNGNILLYGNNTNTRPALKQFLSNGQIDVDFGIDGTYTCAIPSILTRSMRAINDHKVVLSGVQLTGNVQAVLIGVLLDLELGLDKFSDLSSPGFWIFPNPIKDHATVRFTLDGNTNMSIKLADSQGRILRTFFADRVFEQGETEVSLDFPDALPSGHYFLLVESAGETRTIQVMKP